MSNAEPESTTSTSHQLEDANGQSSLVAVSEENLAALMRAMMGSSEPEAPRPAEQANAAPAIDAKESSAEGRPPRADSPAPVTNAPSNVVESRLALFAAVKENRAAISRSGPTPPTSPAIDQSPVAKAKPTPPKAAPPVTLPETAPLVPAKSVSVATPTPAAPLYVTPLSPKLSPATPSPITPSHDPSHETPRSRLAIGLVIGAVIAIVVGVSIFLTRASKAPAAVASKVNVPQQTQSEPPAQARVEPPLQVRAEPLGKGLIEVRWNPQSVPIAQARVGRLVITEHNQKPRVLSLEGGQLKTGHLMYQSAADSIEFDLEIVDRSGATVKESVLALQSPMSSPQPAVTPPQTSSEQAATAKPQNTPNLVAATQTPQPSQPSVRTFVAPTSQRNTEQRVIVDAPTLSTTAPVMVPGVGLTAAPAVISPPPPKDVAAPQAAQQQVRVESSVQAANLVKKVVPVYPQLARSTRIQGTVRFTAHIGKDGRILNLKFMNGPPVLVDSAAAAVKQWVYRPTLLNGVPVEVITQIDVNFTLHQDTH